MQTQLKVSGMKCEGCKRAVIKALEKVDGVNLVNIDLPTGQVQIETEKPVDQSELIQAIEKAGYTIVQ